LARASLRGDLGHRRQKSASSLNLEGESAPSTPLCSREEGKKLAIFHSLVPVAPGKPSRSLRLPALAPRKKVKKLPSRSATGHLLLSTGPLRAKAGERQFLVPSARHNLLSLRANVQGFKNAALRAEGKEGEPLLLSHHDPRYQNRKGKSGLKHSVRRRGGEGKKHLSPFFSFGLRKETAYGSYRWVTRSARQKKEPMSSLYTLSALAEGW